MSIGVWEPSAAKPSVLKPDDWQLLVSLCSLPVETAIETVSGQSGEDLSYLMKLPADAWQVAACLADADIEALVRLFTLAEMQLSGWQAGNSSPVIPLVKLLRARNAFSRELRRWIRANTDNRYLPYGSAL